MFTSPKRRMASGSIIGGGSGSCLGLDLLEGGHGALSMDPVDILHLGE